MLPRAAPYPPSELFTFQPQRTFSGPDLLQIALPLGGIGAGCICLNGYGGLQDFSIRNAPLNSAMPDGSLPADAAFATLRIPSTGVTRLVEGPLPVEKVYDQGLKAQGYTLGGYEGLPRFRSCTFQGEYPFGTVHLTDPVMPLRVKITGFNPFIPLDDRDSSIPCAILEYRLENNTSQPVDYEFSYHLSHLAPGLDPQRAPHSRNAAIPGTGVYFYNQEDPQSEVFGSAALAVVGQAAQVKAMWLRGGWFDGLSVLWREISSGNFSPNGGTNPGSSTGRNGGSILLTGELKPGEHIIYPIIIAWYFPNIYYTAGRNNHPDTVSAGIGAQPCQECTGPGWHPYYVSRWADAKEVANYVLGNYTTLRQRTQAFHDALFRSTLPDYVLEAISANLAILKSPTVLRQANGNLWGWEGIYHDRGCCSGTCTHVWNYAQSLAYLFPQLERGLREQELEQSMDAGGHVNFRAALPDGPTSHSFRAASDGQLGGIMKVYREWQISGDREWLQKMYPPAKRSMDYCIETWDPKHKGVLEEPHHNTYDIEFWGPDGMCTSFYLGALAAMAAMGRATGHPDEAPAYEELGRKGAQYLDDHLFNGEYFEQKVIFEGLMDTSFVEFLARAGDGNSDEEKLLVKDGPRYQYGPGCISDGVLGAWLARLCGLETPENHENIRTSLRAIFEYNFKPDLWEHANTQRPGFAMGGEAGLLLCTWPHGGRPALPFVYSDEVWTGIEYQVASHLIMEGFVAEGLTIVKALRSRYAGHARNPWNEYECGSYYARAMSSYALLEALSGFHYSAPDHHLVFEPKINQEDFIAFFSTSSGWGTAHLTTDCLEILMVEGNLSIKTLDIYQNKPPMHFEPNRIARPGIACRINLLPDQAS